ncbi:hypothetical protein FKM82_024990, partial [Ascaphus truei]
LASQRPGSRFRKFRGCSGGSRPCIMGAVPCGRSAQQAPEVPKEVPQELVQEVPQEGGPDVSPVTPDPPNVTQKVPVAAHKERLKVRVIWRRESLDTRHPDIHTDSSSCSSLGSVTEVKGRRGIRWRK